MDWFQANKLLLKVHKTTEIMANFRRTRPAPQQSSTGQRWKSSWGVCSRQPWLVPPPPPQVLPVQLQLLPSTRQAFKEAVGANKQSAKSQQTQTCLLRLLLRSGRL